MCVLLSPTVMEKEKGMFRKYITKIINKEPFAGIF